MQSFKASLPASAITSRGALTITGIRGGYHPIHAVFVKNSASMTAVGNCVLCGRANFSVVAKSIMSSSSTDSQSVSVPPVCGAYSFRENGLHG
ncbi:MAG: hypothetical protein OEZ03_04810 [Alphaproteobacteria bacterium]|nr:hypothetical protein [Alphaproteobacteria bacterium]